ncbi:hypothetical protein ACPF04_06405 [Campylobacter sp. MOP51]|uniref:hypothetical protein n=1 Tax=Campylobacter canis TaxID=3378588 RepID=UPI003C33FBF5
MYLAFILCLIAILAYSAKEEYALIYKFGYNTNYLPVKATNADLIDASVHTIFNAKWGEFIAFLYPISFLAVIISMWQYTHEYNISTFWSSLFLLICGFIIFCHIIVPYQFSYLRFYEQALKRDINLAKWIDVATNKLFREDTVKQPYSHTKPEIKKIYELEEINQYNNLIQQMPLQDISLNPLDQETFIKILPHLNGHNLFFFNQNNQLTEIYYEDKEVEISRIVFGVSSLGMSMMKKQTINQLVYSRYGDIAMFFLIHELIRVFTIA